MFLFFYRLMMDKLKIKKVFVCVLNDNWFKVRGINVFILIIFSGRCLKINGWVCWGLDKLLMDWIYYVKVYKDIVSWLMNYYNYYKCCFKIFVKFLDSVINCFY